MNILAWYVLRSKPHKESQVYNQPLSNQVEVYYPTLKVKPVNPRSAKIRPYSPGYLFVHVNLQDTGLSALQWLPGAVGLVQFDGYAPAVLEYYVEEILQRIDAIHRSGGLTLDGFHKGDPVRITSGLLIDYGAIMNTSCTL